MKEKIEFLKTKLNLIADLEIRGAVLDLIEMIEVKETIPIDEEETRKDIFISYYKQYPDKEICRRLLNNFNINFAMNDSIPKSIRDSILFGFEWARTPEGHTYWSRIVDNIN